MWLTRLFLILVVLATGCDQPPAPQPKSSKNNQAVGQVVIKPGGIYSCKSGNGDFSIVKVLVVEGGGVHACLHKNRYKERPTSVDPEELEVAIGSVPLSEVGFRNWEPVLLLEQPVTDDELEGYRLWRDQ